MHVDVRKSREILTPRTVECAYFRLALTVMDAQKMLKIVHIV